MPISKDEFINELLKNSDNLYSAFLKQDIPESLLDQAEEEIGELTPPTADPLSNEQIKQAVETLEMDNKLEKITLTTLGIVLMIVKAVPK